MEQFFDMRKPIFKKVSNLNFLYNTMKFERNGNIYEIAGFSSKSWQQTFELMDGTRTIDNISQETSVSTSDLSQLVDMLHKKNVIGIADDNRILSGEEFWQLHDEYSRQWLDKIAEHSLWPALTQGTADRAVAIGFVIEKYHYIEGAYEHMAFAAANADPRISKDLTRHFKEEYLHGDIYLGGLSSLFPKKSIVESLPLPSTRALINCLNELAQSNSFAYYSANEFLQKTENIGDGISNPVETFYEAIERNYNLPPAICRAMRAHTDQDQDLGHQDVFAEMCTKLGTISIPLANEYLQATKQIAEHLEYFLDGILSYYSKYSYVPRSKASLANE